MLALSTLHFHTDRTDPKPILAKSWKPADGKDRCPHARPGVIVLGEGQGTFLQVCIAKKECQKHWARSKPSAAAQQSGGRDDAEARSKQEEAWAKQRAESERWRTELRPRAVRVIADRTAKLPWSRMLLRLLLEDIRIDDLFLDVVGKPEALPVNRYPQAVATALALRHSWQRDDLVTFSKRLGVKVTSKDLADHADSTTPDPKTRKASPDRPRKTPSKT